MRLAAVSKLPLKQFVRSYDGCGRSPAGGLRERPISGPKLMGGGPGLGGARPERGDFAKCHFWTVTEKKGRYLLFS